MSEDGMKKNERFLLIGSVIANIFLVAFVLGRFSAQGQGMMPPHHGMPMEGEFAERGAPPRPPGFGPRALFNDQEMRDNESQMRINFDQMTKLRQDFAAQLRDHPISKEEALKHFAEIDQIMESVKKESQEKAAAKISAMTDADRVKFAKELEQDDRASFMPPPPPPIDRDR